MPISKANLTQAEKIALISHSKKHKVYPYPFRFRKEVTVTDFNKADGSIGNYFTMTFTAPEILPIISIGTSLIVRPNTTIGIFAMVVSYKPTMSFQDAISPLLPTDEGSIIYQLLTNGGVINDFQVFYPLNWYMERNSQIYMHVYADRGNITDGTSQIQGQFILGTMPTGE